MLNADVLRIGGTERKLKKTMRGGRVSLDYREKAEIEIWRGSGTERGRERE